MTLPIFWSDKIKDLPSKQFSAFFQMMSNRLQVGHVRYPNGKDFIKRLELELKEFKRKGNGENLLNVANYAALAYVKQEHPNFHHDKHVDSASRGKV